MEKISAAVAVTEEEIVLLPKLLSSLKGLADEIVIIDMTEGPSLRSVIDKFELKVYEHKRVLYVEEVRNFGTLKATGDWVLVMDPDEEISQNLAKHLIRIVQNPKADYYRVPRKNIIFGKWIKHTRWWPDYNIRFFKKGYVSWSEEIHRVPLTQGSGADLPEKEDLAITHHNYTSIESYITRMLRYTKAQSEGLLKGGYVFKWQDLITKPSGEFFSRFFAGEGYKDGLHGFSISLLQAFSEFVVYLRVWEKQGFKEEEIKESEFKKELKKFMKDLGWWIGKKLSWLKFLR